jgi:toxin-antitoxin system, antitoxin component, ribbon-helix-helix domain protein
MDIKENKVLQKETQQSYQETKQPNKTTIDAIKEGRKIAKDPNAKGYHTVNEMKKALES